MPNVGTACMDVFLEELAEEINLPPYCPELNPVERLWKFIKDNTIKNKVFETLKNLEDEVCEFVKNLTDEVVLGIC